MALTFYSILKTTSLGRGQSATALPVARLSGTPSLSCPHSIRRGVNQ